MKQKLKRFMAGFMAMLTLVGTLFTNGTTVFIAQHATATCCRECIRKWHKMQPGKELSQVQQDYLVDVIMTWIQREMERQEHII